MNDTVAPIWAGLTALAFIVVALVVIGTFTAGDRQNARAPTAQTTGSGSPNAPALPHSGKRH